MTGNEGGMDEHTQNEPEETEGEEELEEQDGELLPDREQMTMIQPDGGLSPPAP